MEWLVSLLGAALIMAALRDLFHTLWHPTRHGGLSPLVMAAMWKLARRLRARRRVVGLVGPLAMATVVGMLHRSDPSVRQLDSSAGASLLGSLATEVVRVRIDFTQYAEAYYFHDGEDHSSLAATIGHATHLVQRGRAARRADVRLTADLLAGALEDLATILDQRFLHADGTPAEVFAAYAADHGRALAGP
ncbi:hypothetical protein AB0K16_58675 [Nonomuraea jabiensis]|uniref:hypothetical protein n=1 Tax=Nonomuraea jabiensis TaxID=882448 RepID=UPI003439BEF7